ncbi:hypothetical protein N7527_011902 [Penicillium freii]|nr:hypothetical protein N7527_011902 [Penicillium freii]
MLDVNALEAEMRRRLWWSLIIFDNRIGEMSDYQTSSLAPTWDCHNDLLVAMAVTTSLLSPCLAIICGTQVTWKLQPRVDEDRGEGEQLSPCVRRLE